MKQKLQLADMTEFYLVDLLSRFLHTANLTIDEEKNIFEEPLALQLYKALEQKTLEEKIDILKKIGDVALYITGFFSQYLGRKSVDDEYYITMGKGAYGAVSELSRRKPKKEIVTEIFIELSAKFRNIVDLLTEVSELSKIADDSDLMNIYEKWLKTKSPLLKKKLLEKGIVPVLKEAEETEN